jgi:hypothetical protein
MLEVDLDASKLVLGTSFLPVSTFYRSSSRGLLFRKLFLQHEAYHRSFPGIPKYLVAQIILFAFFRTSGHAQNGVFTPS